MANDIKLSGAQISMLKGIGLAGSPVQGELFLNRMKDMERLELLDTLTSLMKEDYVMSNKVNVMNIEDVERASFRVNPQHAKDLRDALRGKKRDDNKRERRRRE